MEATGFGKINRTELVIFSSEEDPWEKLLGLLNMQQYE